MVRHLGPLQGEREEGGHDEDGEDRPGEEGEGQGERHRAEDLPLHPLHRVEGEEGGEQDRLREEDGLAHLGDRLGDGGPQRAHLVAALLQDAQEVLGHHHGRIDDDAEIDRSHGDQIGGDAAEIEEEEGAEERQRHDRGDDERRTPVAEPEKEDEHQKNEADPLGHVLAHGVESAFDELRPIVVGDDLHPRRQLVAVDLLDLRPHPGEHLQSVFPLAQEDGPLNDVVLVGGVEAHQGEELAHPPEAERRPLDHLAHVLDQDRGAAAGGDGDGADVRQALHHAEPAHDVHLAAMLDVGAAGVPVARREGVEHLL